MNHDSFVLPRHLRHNSWQESPALTHIAHGTQVPWYAWESIRPSLYTQGETGRRKRHPPCCTCSLLHRVHTGVMNFIQVFFCCSFRGLDGDDGMHNNLPRTKHAVMKSILCGLCGSHFDRTGKLKSCSLLSLTKLEQAANFLTVDISHISSHATCFPANLLALLKRVSYCYIQQPPFHPVGMYQLFAPHI